MGVIVPIFLTNIKGYITVYLPLVQRAQFHYRSLIQDFVAPHYSDINHDSY